ncbi:alternative ribosome rescue aminoacyl-tRNA hydrolase ArfB [Flavobacterium sp.]|jgi:ribosome-associated protein|uniref:alternative ribosome rescue aminoacyl-tRNA hydrolase ArfB n=1 Tax=Flavobacterium sp. TaxID=239 RepID=UPI0022CB0E55|nr:alternative ribosome rescue aminoacyl-tRNA hydrolase ArfB [Flavobacterium sp.]MCZ8146036.1 alternative ribosome rescue aminoacyl-tRNA hydrolase ArfB [Flavobacterium sp.]MCZ8366843.1 alternative ribosome rescue aminoacyl-tRNA hydrolase ArfB [Flavobacterium sp.]
MNSEILLAELQFKAVRSSGAGGQNVNKVASKAVLTWDVQASQAVGAQEKIQIMEKLAARISNEGVLQITSEADRSQLKNRTNAEKKLLRLVAQALEVAKPRKATNIPYSVKMERLAAKKSKSEIKQNRRKPNF